MKVYLSKGDWYCLNVDTDPERGTVEIEIPDDLFEQYTRTQDQYFEVYVKLDELYEQALEAAYPRNTGTR